MDTDKWVFDPVEPRADYICDNPETRDERIFALVVGLFEPRNLYDWIGRLDVFLCLYPSKGLWKTAGASALVQERSIRTTELNSEFDTPGMPLLDQSSQFDPIQP